MRVILSRRWRFPEQGVSGARNWTPENGLDVPFGVPFKPNLGTRSFPGPRHLGYGSHHHRLQPKDPPSSSAIHADLHRWQVLRVVIFLVLFISWGPAKRSQLMCCYHTKGYKIDVSQKLGHTEENKAGGV